MVSGLVVSDRIERPITLPNPVANTGMEKTRTDTSSSATPITGVKSIQAGKTLRSAGGLEVVVGILKEPGQLLTVEKFKKNF